MAGVTVTPYFTPTSITGCRLWLDAQDNSTISLTSGRVSTVTDKALNTTFTSVGPTPANLTVASASINSFQSFYFNNSAGNYAGLSGNLAQLTTGTAIFVMKYISSQNGPWRGIFGWNDVTSVQSISFGMNLNGTGTVGPYVQNIGYNGSATATLTNNALYIVSFTFTGTTTGVGYNGQISLTAGTVSSYSGSSTSIGICQEVNGTQMTAVYLGELIIYNTVLGLSDRQNIESYLGQKWGLTSSLPAGHPGINSIVYRSLIPAPVRVTPYASVTYTFAPTQISNCQLWLDSYDPLGTGTPPSYGATFTTLADKSGNSRNFSVNTGTTYYCNYESRPSIFISNSIMYVSNAVDLTSYTIFIVCQSSNYADNQTTFVALTNSNGASDYNSYDSFGFYVDAATNRNRFYGSINTNVVYNSLTAVGANYYPLSQTCYSSTSGGSLLSYPNGNVGGSQNAGITRTGTARGFAIGADYASGVLYTTSPKVFINEIIVYNFVLSDTQRRQVEAYLSQKWALTTFLPGGHTGLTVTHYVNQSFLSRAASTIPSKVISQPKYTTSGLIFHLDAGIAASYSGSGSTWYDLAGSGLTTTLYNSPTYSSANGGYIAFVPSSSQYAQTSASLGSRSRWTVEVWHYYNATNNGGYGCIVVENYNPGSQINFLIGPPNSGSSTTLSAGYWNGSSWQATTNGYSLPSNSWYHIVGSYDGTNLNLYVNGTLTQVQASAGTPASSGLGIRFMRRWDNPEYWGGYLSIVRIYNRALSLTEVGVNYNGSRTRFTNPVPPS